MVGVRNTIEAAKIVAEVFKIATGGPYILI